MKCLFTFLFSFLLMAGLAQQVIVDANAQSRTINASFNAIKVSGGIEVFLSQSAQESLAVSASETKYINDIKTVVENNTLIISTDGKWYGKNKKIKVYIAFKNLQSLQASGACDVKISGSIKVSSFSLNFSGASKFNGNVKVDQLDIHVTGASDIVIAGNAKSVTVNTSGASDIKAKNLQTEICDIKASGASDITIIVNKEINAVASGASSVIYSGNATEGKIVKTGASSVSKRS